MAKKIAKLKLGASLVRDNFTLTYVKKGRGSTGEGAEFRTFGEVVTDEDRLAVARFVAAATGDRTPPELFKFVDSRGPDKPFNSEIVDTELLSLRPENFDNYED